MKNTCQIGYNNKSQIQNIFLEKIIKSVISQHFSKGKGGLIPIIIFIICLCFWLWYIRYIRIDKFVLPEDTYIKLTWGEVTDTICKYGYKT